MGFMAGDFHRAALLAARAIRTAFRLFRHGKNFDLRQSDCIQKMLVIAYYRLPSVGAEGFLGRYEGLLSVQDVKTVKRTLSTLLILMFGLGPLVEAIPACAASSLPACCRRHGAHRCAMSVAKASIAPPASSSSTPVLAAPLHCPYFPGYTDVSSTPVFAMVASATGPQVLLAQSHSPAASRAAARLSQFRTRTGRAPPPKNIG